LDKTKCFKWFAAPDLFQCAGLNVEASQKLTSIKLFLWTRENVHKFRALTDSFRATKP